MDRVGGRDDGGSGRDDGRRYFPLIFLLVTSDFSLSFDFSPLAFLLFLLFLLLLLVLLLLFNISEDWHKDMEEF